MVRVQGLSLTSTSHLTMAQFPDARRVSGGPPLIFLFYTTVNMVSGYKHER